MTSSARLTIPLLLWVPVLVTGAGCKPTKRSPDAGGALPATANADLSGRYTITNGRNPGAEGPYKGTAVIDRRETVYHMQWNIHGSSAYHGVGLDVGTSYAVGWGRSAVYGLAVYTIDGKKLHGVRVSNESDSLGVEELAAPVGPSGAYTVTHGETASGEAYTGTVEIGQQGATFTVTWRLSNAPPYTGIALQDGNKLLVGWGTPSTDAGVMMYKLSGTSLVGTWGIYGEHELGGETLVRK